MRIVRGSLEIPGHLPSVHVQRDQAGRVQIVAITATAGITGSGIARAKNVEVRFRIVGAGNPGGSATVARRIEARPGIEPRIAGVLRSREELPLESAGFRIQSLQ